MEAGETICVCRSEDLYIYKLVSTQLRDHEDTASSFACKATSLDDRYVLHWLRQFEQVLNDSTLVTKYPRLRRGEL